MEVHSDQQKQRDRSAITINDSRWHHWMSLLLAGRTAVTMLCWRVIVVPPAYRPTGPRGKGEASEIVISSGGRDCNIDFLRTCSRVANQSS